MLTNVAYEEIELKGLCHDLKIAYIVCIHFTSEGRPLAPNNLLTIAPLAYSLSTCIFK